MGVVVVSTNRLQQGMTYHETRAMEWPREECLSIDQSTWIWGHSFSTYARRGGGGSSKCVRMRTRGGGGVDT